VFEVIYVLIFTVLMLFVLLALDGMAPPIGLTSVTARANGTQLMMEGRYQAGSSTPILIWPSDKRLMEPWVNPCRKATDLCCLRDVNAKYRNDALASVQGPQCLKSLPPNLVAGSRPGVEATSTSFRAVVPINSPFVAILFVHESPFFILDGYQAFKTESVGNVESSLTIAHNPCYSVVVPGTLASVCMQCNNPLPPNARYLWTPSWSTDYFCDWQCDANYVRVGMDCEVALRRVPLVGIVVGACAAVVCIVFIIYWSLRRVSAAAPEPPEVDFVRVKSDIIQFKDGGLQIPLRMKRN